MMQNLRILSDIWKWREVWKSILSNRSSLCGTVVSDFSSLFYTHNLISWFKRQNFAAASVVDVSRCFVKAHQVESKVSLLLKLHRAHSCNLEKRGQFPAFLNNNHGYWYLRLHTNINTMAKSWFCLIAILVAAATIAVQSDLASAQNAGKIKIYNFESCARPAKKSRMTQNGA